MFNQKYIVMFVDRNRIQVIGGTGAVVIHLDIPETYIYDLDIVSKDGCYSAIKQWVKDNALVGGQLIMIFSESSYFEKVFSLKEQSQIESDVLKFFDMVPFDSIWTKVYSTDKGKRAVAINKMYYDAIHQGFSLQGLQTKAVIPAFALGALSVKKSLDTELNEYILKNIDSLIKQSLLDSQELSVPVPHQKIDEASSSGKKKSQLPMLLSVFGILLAILGVVAYIQFK